MDEQLRNLREIMNQHKRNVVQYPQEDDEWSHDKNSSQDDESENREEIMHKMLSEARNEVVGQGAYNNYSHGREEEEDDHYMNSSEEHQNEEEDEEDEDEEQEYY